MFIVSGFKLQTVAPTVRAFGHHAPAAPASTADVIIHEDDLVESLEWALNSPPNLHQFDEPPVSFSILLHCKEWMTYFYCFFVFAFFFSIRSLWKLNIWITQLTQDIKFEWYIHSHIVIPLSLLRHPIISSFPHFSIVSFLFCCRIFVVTLRFNRWHHKFANDAWEEIHDDHIFNFFKFPKYSTIMTVYLGARKLVDDIAQIRYCVGLV